MWLILLSFDTGLTLNLGLCTLVLLVDMRNNRHICSLPILGERLVTSSPQVLRLVAPLGEWLEGLEAICGPLEFGLPKRSRPGDFLPALRLFRTGKSWAGGQRVTLHTRQRFCGAKRSCVLHPHVGFLGGRMRLQRNGPLTTWPKSRPWF